MYIDIETRDDRQRATAAWAARTFGGSCMTLRERAARFAEEAIELVQACGLSEEDVLRLIDYVYNRPVGTITQEAGGVGVTLMALCEVAGVSADTEEARELVRVQAKSTAHFRARHEAKAAQGIASPVSEVTE